MQLFNSLLHLPNGIFVKKLKLMKKYLFLLFGLTFLLNSNAQNYDISVKIKGLDCTNELLLANHFGDKQYLRDTSECIDGVFHFRGDKKLESGVYLVVLPNKSWFEILVSIDEDQTNYYFETDTTLNPDVLSTIGSFENKLFSDFTKYASKKGRIANELNKELMDSEDEKRKEELRESLTEMSADINMRRAKLADTYPELFIGRLYKAMLEVKAIDAPKNLDENEAREYQYIWLRNHYWDNIDMSEDGLVRSPVYHTKLSKYLNNFMPPITDTAIFMVDQLMSEIEKGGSDIQYKYTMQYMLDYFQKTKYMCFDKVLHHLAKNYYCNGKAYWADSAFRETMCMEAGKMAPALCDVVAPDLSMPDTTFRTTHTLSQIDKPVTVLIFWDINCGHCKKEMPIVNSYYDSANKEQVEIYAVYTQGDWDGWKERIRDEGYKFINVANAFGLDKFRDYYNIKTTPQIYILDKDKKIRFKKIAATDIKNTVNFLLEEQGIIEKEEEQAN